MSADSQSQASNPDLVSEFDPGANSPESGHSQTYPDIIAPENLSDIQLRAIELIVQGHSDTQTARILSLNPKTLWRWKTLDEDYRESLAEGRLQFHATVTDRYESIIFKATAILVKFLDHETDGNRMKAAQILLNIASRYKPAPLAKRRPANPPEYNWPEPVLEPKVG